MPDALMPAKPRPLPGTRQSDFQHCDLRGTDAGVGRMDPTTALPSRTSHPMRFAPNDAPTLDRGTRASPNQRQTSRPDLTADIESRKVRAAGHFDSTIVLSVPDYFVCAAPELDGPEQSP